MAAGGREGQALVQQAEERKTGNEQEAKSIGCQQETRRDGPLGLYECNVCLELAHESPVVTLCGHLYCRQCIMSWLCEGHSTCPLCKSTLSQKALIRIVERERIEYAPDAECILRHRAAGTSRTADAIKRTSSIVRACIDAAIASEEDERQNSFLARLLPTVAIFVLVVRSLHVKHSFGACISTSAESFSR